MEEQPSPFDMSFVLEMSEPPTLEEELQLEKEIRAIRESDDLDELKRYAENLSRQNYEQSSFIAGCLKRVAMLYAKIAYLKTNVQRPSKSLLAKILGL